MCYLSMVLIHEWGHFFVAKKSGIHVYEFAIGMGPKLFSFTKNETKFSIRLFPIGGYVEMAGMDKQTKLINTKEELAVCLNEDGEITAMGRPDDLESFQLKGMVKSIDVDETFTLEIETSEGVSKLPIKIGASYIHKKRTYKLVERKKQYYTKSKAVRFLTVLAGPFMNFVLAFVIFFGLITAQGVASPDPIVANVMSQGPAQVGGMMAGDKIVAINGQNISSWSEFAGMMAKEKANDYVSIVVDRQGALKSMEVWVGSNHKIGVTDSVTHNPIMTIRPAFEKTYEFTKAIFVALGQLLTHKDMIKAVSGPVGIVAQIHTQSDAGLYSFCILWAFLNINIGFMNLMPLPALDGSRLFLIFVELLRGKPLSMRVENLIHSYGIVFWFLLGIFITIHDVVVRI